MRLVDRLLRGLPLSRKLQQDQEGPPSQLGLPPVAQRLILGLDLGEVKDYTALVGLQQSKETEAGQARRLYRCGTLVRWPLHTGYEAIIEHVRAMIAALPAPPYLVVDATGAGRPVVQMFRRARLPVQQFVPVLITGGAKVERDAEGYWHVAKRELVSCVSSVLQSRRLKLARTLSEARTLVRELQTFRYKISATTANESFEAWREKDHDDMVLAVALALWFGEQNSRRLGAEHFGFV